MQQYPGRFIVFEGGEGSGKSTQLRRLETRLTHQGYQVITTREPGGSEEAEKIRELLVTGEKERWDDISELLLFFAARRHHVQTLIKPALAAGDIVLCDRFISSSLALQIYARQASIVPFETLSALVLGSFTADFTLFFDIDPILGVPRALQRRGVETRFEFMPDAFHQRARKGYQYAYLRITQNGLHPDRAHMIEIMTTSLSAEEHIREIADEVYSVVKPHLPSVMR